MAYVNQNIKFIDILIDHIFAICCTYKFEKKKINNNALEMFFWNTGFHSFRTLFLSFSCWNKWSSPELPLQPFSLYVILQLYLFTLFISPWKHLMSRGQGLSYSLNFVVFWEVAGNQGFCLVFIFYWYIIGM